MMLTNKLFKYSLFQGIIFPENQIYEDVATVYLLIERADKVSLCGNHLYNIFLRENSLSNSAFSLMSFNYIYHLTVGGR